jgi:apolipoprotein N-acyltransferase
MRERSPVELTKRAWGRPSVGCALAVCSALLLFAAGEPLGIGVLAWVALVPLLAAVLAADRTRWSAAYGFVFGIAYFGVHLSWIFLFGWMAWTALVIVLSLYGTVGTLVGGSVRRSRFAPLLVAGSWTGAELLRDRWPFGGYPWGAVGTTQGAVPGVRSLAGSVGVYGLSFLVAFACACFAWLVVERRIPWRCFAVVAGVLVVFVVADRAVSSGSPAGRRFSVAVIQSGVPRPPIHGPHAQRDAIMRGHIRLTRAVLSHRRVDLVVWPEDSIGIGVSPGAFDEVKKLVRKEKTPFIVGHSVLEPVGERFLNLVQYLDPHGKVRDTYQKRHPVPFGEYVPISTFRRFVGTLREEVPDDLVPGRTANVFRIDGAEVATPICFESVFPRDFLDFVHNGADLFVLSTNNVSFGHSYASQQHLAHTRMRALETRQWVVQAALAGISAEISPDGTIRHATKLFRPAAFVADVRTRPARSLYSRTGDLFPSIFAVLALLGASWELVRRRFRRGLESSA